jgi:hypothetical protein
VGGSLEFPVSSSTRPELRKKFGLVVAVVEGDGGGIGAARHRSRRVRPTRESCSMGNEDEEIHCWLYASSCPLRTGAKLVSN